MRYNKVPDKARWYIRTAIVILFLCALILLYVLKCLCTTVIDINEYIPFYIDVDLVFKIIYAILFVVSILLVIFLPKLISRNYGFYTDKYFFKIKSGVIFKTISVILVKDVYKVCVKKKLIGRIFGISSITLYTSAGNVKINFLDDKKREVLFNNITFALKNYEVS